MFNLIKYILFYRRRQRQKWLNKWILWHTLHPDFEFHWNSCSKMGCKYWSDKGFHTCPWNCLMVDGTLRKLDNYPKLECHCIEWIKDV